MKMPRTNQRSPITRSAYAIRSPSQRDELFGTDSETQVRSFKILRRGGRLISLVSPPDPALAEQRGIEAQFFLVDVTTARLERIAAMLASGTLSADIGAVLRPRQKRTVYFRRKVDLS